MNADIISGTPLEKLIIDLASDDKPRSDHAGDQLYFFLCGVKDANEYQQRKTSEDPLVWPFPKPEYQAALQLAVPSVFQRDGFPVEATVAGLARHVIEQRKTFIHALHSPDAKEEFISEHRGKFVSNACSFILPAVGPSASVALSILIDMLQTKIQSQQIGYTGHTWTAARAIASMGEFGAPAFNSLAGAYCENRDEPLLEAMVKIASQSRIALDRTLEMTNDPDAKRRRLTLDVLDKLEPPPPALRAIAMRALGDSDKSVQKQAGTVLRRHFASDPEVLAALEPPKAISANAMTVIKPVEPWVRDCKSMSEWLEILANSQDDRQDQAYDCLSSMYYGLNDIPGDKTDQQWRKIAPTEFAKEIARVFSCQGFPAIPVIHGLIAELRAPKNDCRSPQSLNSNDLSKRILRRNLLKIICENVGPVGAGALDAWIGLVVEDCRRSDDSLSRTGVLALGSMGDAALPAFPKVFDKAVERHGKQWPNPWENVLVKWAENQASIIAQLVVFLDDSEPQRRIAAASVLGRLGARALPALDAALRVADEKGPSEESILVPIFAATAAVSDAARIRLRRLTEHADVVTRAPAMASLCNFPETDEAVRMLKRGLKDTDPYIRWSALCAICDASIPDSKKAEYCVSLLDDFDGHDHWIPAFEGVKRLVKLGPAAAPAIPAILKDEFEEEKNAVITILENVGPNSAKPALVWLQGQLKDALLHDPLIENDLTMRLRRLVEGIETNL